MSLYNFETVLLHVQENKATELFMDSFHETHQVVALAEALKANTSVTFLDLRYCRTSMEGLVAIGEALKQNKTITFIISGSNDLSDEGARVLCDALCMNERGSVRDLDFGNGDIGVEGIRHLCRVLNKKPIKSVYIGRNSLQIDSFRLLGQMLKENCTLKQFHVADEYFFLDCDVEEALVSGMRFNGNIVAGNNVEKMNTLFKRNRLMHERTAASCVAFMACWQRTKQMPKEIFNMIALHLWNTRSDITAWSEK